MSSMIRFLTSQPTMLLMITPMTLTSNIYHMCVFLPVQNILPMRLATLSHIASMTLGAHICNNRQSHLSCLEFQKMSLMELNQKYAYG